MQMLACIHIHNTSTYKYMSCLMPVTIIYTCAYPQKDVYLVQNKHTYTYVFMYIHIQGFMLDFALGGRLYYIQSEI